MHEHAQLIDGSLNAQLQSRGAFTAGAAADSTAGPLVQSWKQSPPPPYKQGTPNIELGLISKGSHWDYAIFRFNRSNISIQ